MTRTSYTGPLATLLAAVGVGVVAALVVLLGPAALSARAESPITVNSKADNITPDNDNECTLREAILNANADTAPPPSPDCAAGSGADIIVFALEQSETITLGSTLPIVTDTDGLTIDGGSASITVSGNNAVRVFHVAQNAKLTLENLTVARGSAADTGVSSGTFGGGVFNDRGTLEVSGSTFSENSASNQGGAIYASGVAPLTVTDSTFSNNKATGIGGAIRGGNPLTVTGSTFSENSAGNSGGALMTGSISSPSTVTNSTFWKNSAENFFGGGIRNSGLLTVTNSTFSENSASEDNVTGGFTGGGAIANLPSGSSSTPSSTTLRNTILAASQGGNCQNAASSTVGAFTDGGYNISSDASCNLTDPTSNPDTNPLLDSAGLQDNGGPTKTIALQEGSPAIDKGNSFSFTTDQRGVERPQDNLAIQNASGGDGSDIGAFEVDNTDATAPTVTTWSPTSSASKKATVTATFSEDVQNVNTTTFKLERVIAVKKSPTKYEPVAATVTPSSGIVAKGANATLTPSQDLPNGTYRGTLTGGVTDTAGNALVPKTWSFTVRK